MGCGRASSRGGPPMPPSAPHRPIRRPPTVDPRRSSRSGASTMKRNPAIHGVKAAVLEGDRLGLVAVAATGDDPGRPFRGRARVAGEPGPETRRGHGRGARAGASRRRRARESARVGAEPEPDLVPVRNQRVPAGEGLRLHRSDPGGAVRRPMSTNSPRPSGARAAPPASAPTRRQLDVRRYRTFRRILAVTSRRVATWR